ncbi:hypothetical protein [Hypericibacter sp.]|uniref:hypothetical protein n=1 Tax=Hypericibacter sp. TaxID=2705401 RepID=UPI003D6D81FE
MLEQHRDVFIPRHKETHFFTEQWHWKSAAFYEAQHFLGCVQERAVDESTPDYMRYPEVPARLQGYFKLLPPGSLAIQTGNAWSNAVIERPSRSIDRRLRHLATHLTETLDDALLQRLYRQEFKDEIGRLEEFLGRDLARWRHD